jgi:Tol biopolymer transport system component
MRQMWSFATLVAAASAACGGGSGDAGGSPDSGATGDASADAPDGAAAASADRFLFCSARSGNFEIYRHEDGEVTRLTEDASQDAWWPRISPDHQRVVFYRSAVADRPETGGWDNNYEHATLWIMDADGGEARELLTLEDQGWSAQGVANWSPDGENLVMVARDAESGLWQLHIMKVDVTGPVVVSQRESFYVDPSWSPVGDKIVFAAFPPDAVGVDLAQLEIYVANFDGTNEVRLTDDDVRDHDPSWSPDGTSIVFESEMDPEALRWALRTVSIPGGEVETLLDDGNINTLGRFAPDGGMTFHRFILGGAGTWRISHIRRDGTGLRDLTDGSHEDVDADPY